VRESVRSITTGVRLGSPAGSRATAQATLKDWSVTIWIGTQSTCDTDGTR
jgi:hypothetical protein